MPSSSRPLGVSSTIDERRSEGLARRAHSPADSRRSTAWLAPPPGIAAARAVALAPAQRCRVDDEHAVQARETDAALLLQPRVDRPPQDRLEPHQVIEYLPQISHVVSRPRPHAQSSIELTSLTLTILGII